MNPQRTWRLLNFYSAGAVRNRGRTNAKLLQSQSHRTYNCIERGVAPSDTFFSIGITCLVRLTVPQGHLRAPTPPPLRPTRRCEFAHERCEKARRRGPGRAPGGAAAAVRSPTRARAPERSRVVLGGQQRICSMGEMGGEMHREGRAAVRGRAFESSSSSHAPSNTVRR